MAETNSAGAEAEKAAWHDSVDAVIPDWWPMGALQGFFFAIIDWVYDPKIERDWNRGVEQGDRAWNETLGKFQEAKDTVTNYVNQKKAEIDGAINDAFNRISSVKGVAEDALSKAKNAIDQAVAASGVASNANGVSNSAKSLADSAKSSAQSALDKVNQTISALDTLRSRQTSDESTIGDHTGKLVNLIDRVKALESGQVQQKSILERLMGK